jgi:hypothetical protein
MAATLSKYYPDHEPKAGEEFVLKDTLWLPFDNEGLISLHMRGITGPTIEELELAEGKALLEWVDKIPGIVEPMVKSGEITTVVADTISTFMHRLETHFDKVTTDGRDKWGKVFQYAKRLFESLRRLPCNVVWVCHTNELVSMDKQGEAKVAKKQKVVGLPGKFDVIPDIPGKTLKYYRNNSSLILPLLSNTEKGRGTTRNTYPQGNMEYGIEGGGRFAQLLAYEEPADFRPILKKLRAVAA